MNYENLEGGRQPAPRDRVYRGTRTSTTDDIKVERVDFEGPNRTELPSALSPRFDLANHSPTGFNWGYGGSGPAQLALALVADATGDDELARRVYQQVKFRMVAGWGDAFSVRAGEIVDLARELEADA